MDQLPSPKTVFAVGVGLALFAGLGVWFGGCVPLYIRWGK